jgi:hypothetical protein
MLDMPTDATLVIVGLGAAGAAKPATELVTHFLERLFGPTIDYAGQGIRGWVEKRTTRGQQVIVNAATMLQEAGIEPQQVPGRILLPLIEYSSLEDEPELQRKWSSLLANAASPGPENKILPGFTEILRQLTPVQAKILDWMYSQKHNAAPGLFDTWPDCERKDIEGTFNLSPAEYALLITDLERLQVIEPRREITAKDIEGTVDAEEMFRLIVAYWNTRERYDTIGLTSLGIQFIKACTPPKAV